MLMINLVLVLIMRKGMIHLLVLIKDCVWCVHAITITVRGGAGTMEQNSYSALQEGKFDTESFSVVVPV